MRRISVVLLTVFAVVMFASSLFAADTFDLTIPLPLTGKQAKLARS